MRSGQKHLSSFVIIVVLGSSSGIIASYIGSGERVLFRGKKKKTEEEKISPTMEISADNL